MARINGTDPIPAERASPLPLHEEGKMQGHKFRRSSDGGYSTGSSRPATPTTYADSSAKASLKGRTKWISPETKSTLKAAGIALATIAVLGLLIAGGVMVHQGHSLGAAFLAIGATGTLAGGTLLKSEFGAPWHADQRHTRRGVGGHSSIYDRLGSFGAGDY